MRVRWGWEVSHKAEEIVEAMMVNMNGIIEDELLMAALKLEPPLSSLTKDDLKRYAKTRERLAEGKMVVDYIWRERLVLTVMEPSVHPSGKAMVFAVKRHLEDGRVVTPKLIYTPPPPPEPTAEEVAEAGRLMNDKAIPMEGRNVKTLH